MDDLTFYSNIIDSLAWPLFTFLIFLFLRQPITDLIPLIEKLRYKNWEIGFREKLDNVSLGIAKEIPDSITSGPATGANQVALSAIAEYSPKLAVMKAWSSIEAQAIESAKDTAGITISPSARPLQAIRSLQKDPSIDKKIVNFVKDLQALRNTAAHAPDFALSTESALNYASTSQAVVDYLSQKTKD